METLLKEVGLDEKCLEIVRKKDGLEKLAEFFKKHRFQYLDIGEYIDFKAELFDLESYVNPDFEPSISDVLRGEIAVLNGDLLWPEDLKPFLVESDAYLLAYIYGDLKDSKIEASESGRKRIQELRGKFYRPARRKGFELACEKGMLDELYTHYRDFLPDYLSYAERGEEILGRELAHCRALYESFRDK